MAHPLMFDDTDPVLARVRALALAFPDAAEKISHGRPAFYTTKVFAYFGGSVKPIDRPAPTLDRTEDFPLIGSYRQHEHSVVVLLDPDERAALLDDERVYVPAYLGAAGWIGLDVAAGSDWAEINELLDASYRRTAGVRRVAALDARAGAVENRPDRPRATPPSGRHRVG